jgi:hypothetical protein
MSSGRSRALPFRLTRFLARRGQIHNITFRSELVDGEDAVTMTVYYAATPKDDNTVAR